MSDKAREVLSDWLSEAAIRNGFENSHGHSINDHADAIIAALKTAGLKIVPEEPTEDSLNAFRDWYNKRTDKGVVMNADAYRAMLGAVK